MLLLKVYNNNTSEPTVQKKLVSNVCLKCRLHNKKSANHRILAEGGGRGGLDKIVQDMTLTNTPGTNLPRVVSTRGKAYPG